MGPDPPRRSLRAFLDYHRDGAKEDAHPRREGGRLSGLHQLVPDPGSRGGVEILDGELGTDLENRVLKRDRRLVDPDLARLGATERDPPTLGKPMGRELLLPDHEQTEPAGHASFFFLSGGKQTAAISAVS